MTRGGEPRLRQAPWFDIDIHCKGIITGVWFGSHGIVPIGEREVRCGVTLVEFVVDEVLDVSPPRVRFR